MGLRPAWVTQASPIWPPLSTGWRPEAALLLACAHPGRDTTHPEELGTWGRDALDWPLLLQTALQHGVMPLLHRSLLSTSPEAVPIDIRQQLQEAFYVNAGRNLFLSRELLTLLRLLEAQGIAAIPYKGPVLATTAYGSLALRQFSDLDVLVRPQDARRARDVLLAHGYQRLDHRSTARTEPWYRLRKVYELVRADGQILVELHWAITSWTFFFPLHAARLWERLETASLLETPVRSLAREDLLLLLCVHGAKHHWSRLGWICDVAALLQARRSTGDTLWHKPSG